MQHGTLDISRIFRTLRQTGRITVVDSGARRSAVQDVEPDGTVGRAAIGEGALPLMLDNIWAVHRRTAFQLSEVSNSQEVDRADVQAALDANNRHVSSTFVRINDMRFQVPSPLVSDRSFVISAPEATFITYFHNWLGSLDDDLDEGLKLPFCHFCRKPVFVLYLGATVGGRRRPGAPI